MWLTFINNTSTEVLLRTCLLFFPPKELNDSGEALSAFTFICPNYIRMCLAGESDKVFAKWGSSIFLCHLFPTMIPNSGGLSDMTHIINHQMEQGHFLCHIQHWFHPKELIQSARTKNWWELSIHQQIPHGPEILFPSEQKLETKLAALYISSVLQLNVETFLSKGWQELKSLNTTNKNKQQTIRIIT